MSRRPRDRASEVARAFANARERGRASDRARALALVNACTRYLDLHSATPRRLVALAVRLLPVAQQLRYREEFRAEMVDLQPRERWGYALWVLADAWQLRRALVEVTRTPDGAPTRQAER